MLGWASPLNPLEAFLDPFWVRVGYPGVATCARVRGRVATQIGTGWVPWGCDLCAGSGAGSNPNWGGFGCGEQPKLERVRGVVRLNLFR